VPIVDDTQPIARAPSRRRTALRVTIVGLLLVFSALGLAVEGALSAPGDDPPAAKLAEWRRDNGLGGFVTWLEGVRYAADQPTVGGVPAGGIPAAGGVEKPGSAFRGGLHPGTRDPGGIPATTATSPRAARSPRCATAQPASCCAPTARPTSAPGTARCGWVRR